MMRSALALRKDPHFGLDSTRSWVVTAFLSFVVAMTLVGQQAAGVLFYGIIHTYDVSRQRAAWPIVLTSTIPCLSGPLMGYCCSRYSCQAVLFVCTLLAGTSVGACCFANNILTLSLLYGVTYGIAEGGVFVSANVLVSQYFDKRRTTACSLIFTFSALNMVYVPYLTELCRATYGIRGTFLLLGALMLNAFPPVFTLASPQWLTRQSIGTVVAGSDCEEQVVQDKREYILPEDSLPQKLSINEASVVVDGNAHVKLAETVFARHAELLRCRQVPEEQLQMSHKRDESPQSVLKDFATVKFVVIALSFSVLGLAMTTFLMLAVDLATDRGVAPSKAVFLLNAYAAADISVRPLSGLSIDFGIFPLEGVMFLGFLLQFVACELLALLKALPLMLASSAVFGVSNGCRFTLLAPCLVKNFGVESLPVMMGAVTFCNGLAFLTRPILVGYWRDTLKTYDGLLHFLAGLNAVLAVVWMAQLYMKKRAPPSQGT
ncbi:hypothetical protein HPB50_003391 [Hyalomma asiaticum]|uniref:Uncharacterized protein n=1 Tax=Hyalomma asiaticum TaxID=266040 RepID=A0ACB7RS20_HYAAI|nr:hypothetical protein HPB50_003391 [Hyalomma asiaticum]